MLNLQHFEDATIVIIAPTEVAGKLYLYQAFELPGKFIESTRLKTETCEEALHCQALNLISIKLDFLIRNLSATPVNLRCTEACLLITKFHVKRTVF
jgi:hypothetical protein